VLRVDPSIHLNDVWIEGQLHSNLLDLLVVIPFLLLANSEYVEVTLETFSGGKVESVSDLLFVLESVDILQKL
jgi:hypothetical protein